MPAEPSRSELLAVWAVVARQGCSLYNWATTFEYNSGMKWNLRFIELAKHIATWSKDPSTKTGAVIVDPDRRVVSVGYNGFPKGVDDSPERYANRELKYKMIVHCERNAILFAPRSCKGCTLYTYPFMSCSVCAAIVIQAGITKCVAPVCPPHLRERWEEDLRISEMMFQEAGVELQLLGTP